MILTTHGEMDESALTERRGEYDDENEYTTWVEYWQPYVASACPADCPRIVVDGQEQVHRSVHVTLKRSVMIESEVGGF